MNLKGLTIGDVKIWATKILHGELEAIINAKSRYSLPYYILIIMQDKYIGPPAYGNNNELLHGKDKKLKPHHGPTKTVDMSRLRTMTHRFRLMNTPPPVPMINSALLYVNNKTGQVRFMYILPPDRPMVAGFDIEIESKILANCEKHAPIVYGSQN